MPNFCSRFAALVFLVSTFVVGTPDRTQAQTYPIDCAILLCLSGGWPASVPCTRARAEFIRRITPWPVEPPLQIWRCPMGANFSIDANNRPADRLYDVLVNEDDRAPLKTFPLRSNGVFAETPNPAYRSVQNAFPSTSQLAFLLPTQHVLKPLNGVVRNAGGSLSPLPDGFAVHLVQERADIDISSPEFNFVRSIRVYHVRARQWESGTEDDRECNRYDSTRFGSYGTQGDYRWSRSSVQTLPDAFTGLERYGSHCPGVSVRAVFVDWQDYFGNYGWERVDY